MTPFEILNTHRAKHRYTKGAFENDAPLDPRRRQRTHERVTTRHGNAVVRMHYTDILTVTPDNCVTIQCDGWAGSPTTRDCLNRSLRLIGLPIYICGLRKFGVSQTCLHTPAGLVVYYGGIEFDEKGVMRTLPKPFLRQHVDKEQSATLRAFMKEHGFRDVMRLLHATTEFEDRCSTTPSQVFRLVQDGPEAWPRLMMKLKYPWGWDPAAGKYGPQERDFDSVMQTINAALSTSLKRVSPTDITVIPL